MKLKLLLVLAVVESVGIPPASAATYTLNDTTGYYSLSGTITTDGHLGVLSLADITNWNLTITEIAFPVPSFTMTPVNSVASLIGTNLSATSTALLFDYTFSFPVSYFSFNGTFVNTTTFAQYSDNGFGANFSLNICPGNCNLILVGPSRSGLQTIAVADANTPLPAALPLFASGLGALGLLGWRRKKKAALAA